MHVVEVLTTGLLDVVLAPLVLMMPADVGRPSPPGGGGHGSHHGVG
jgi:hypothetical protein